MTGAILTTLFNVVFLTVVAKNHRLRTTPNKLLVLLSLSDLIQGVTVWPMASIWAGYMAHSYRNLCLLHDLILGRLEIVFLEYIVEQVHFTWMNFCQ